MIPSETIHSILEAGVQAPSGENAQPWRFEVTADGSRISLFNIPENDHSLYNFEQRASLISHGAVIENIVIAAAHFGLSASVALTAQPNESNLVATISLTTAGVKQDASLYETIPKRSTNRKIYKGGDIPASVMNELVSVASGMDGVSIKFISDRVAIEHLAVIASVNDQLLLENRAIHDFFFSHVHWTLKEEEELRSGFYIEVLELLPPAKALFKLFKHWPVMRIFNALGAAKKGAQENSKIYASASAIGTITIANENPASFIAAGRALQRLWLTAAGNGIALQPLTGVLFFHQRIAGSEAQEFTPAEKAAIEDAYAGIRSAFDIKQGTITMMFRIGYADPPTATSLKKSPQIVTK